MTAPPPPALRAYLEALPKTETHLHLEGALPYEYLHALDPAKYPAAAPFHAPEFRFNSFPEFEQTLLEHALAWFTSAERYHEAARAIFARHQTQNVRYVETSFHLPVTEFIGVPVEEIIRAIRSAVPPGLEVRLFAAMARNSYTPSLQPVIEGLVDCDGLTGIDLHGDEAMPTESWATPLWARARAAGLVTKCHAGEFDGAGRVREAIEKLGATRIEHGVRAIEDPAVVALAVERGVTFDVCPLSNVKLRVVPDLARHPLRALLAAGIRCTVSTDDPLVFGYSLIDEYEALSTEAGFTREKLTDLVRNGWAVARIPAEERGRIMTKIDRLAAT